MSRRAVGRILKELLWFIPLALAGVFLAERIGAGYRGDTKEFIPLDWLFVALGPYMARWFVALFAWALKGLKDQ